MPITAEEVKKIAHLAKLSFSEEEEQKLYSQLNQIVTYVEKLGELDTNDVPPTHHVLDLKNSLRTDDCEPWLTQEAALENAPKKKKGYFSVPKVIG